MTPASTPETLDTIQHQLIDWIAKHKERAVSIALDTDLVESRLIDSLQFVSFLLFVEELRGREIPETEISLDKFRTIRSIKSNFF
jgi:acyl carrier protein